MKTPFDFNKLVKHVHTQLEEALSIKEIDELLSLGEEAYQKDSPLSIGKSLTVLSLEFEGEKRHNGVESPIHYQRSFSTGVNIWVGDNLVGKSSIFKIIKLALTGNKKIPKDVESWLSEIWVEFSLGSNVYSIHIDRDKSNRFHFMLFTGAKKDVREGEDQTEKCLFDGGAGKYEEFLQTFFFRELSYYSLQWTQRDGRPDHPELLHTSSASWSTYYKSVYLEADDYNVLFWGSQAELIFQMLLGLELTYPINRLKVKYKLLSHQLGLTRSANIPSDQEASQTERSAEQQELAQVISELEALDIEAKKATEIPEQSTEQRLEAIRQQYRNALNRRGELDKEKDALDNQLGPLQRKITAFTRQIDDYGVDITKKDRHINDLRDLLELGTFFNSLEVRTCPNCNHTVEKHKVADEKNTGNCRLCEHEVKHQSIDKEAYSDQIKRLQQQRQSLYEDQYKLKITRDGVQNELRKNGERIRVIDREINALQIEKLFCELNNLQQAIIAVQPKLFDWYTHSNKVAVLLAQKAALGQKIEISKPASTVGGNEQAYIELQIKAVEMAEHILQQERSERSQPLIQKFESLYLNQLHSFGLLHYERIEVKKNFRVAYYMHGDEYTFEEITAGEKLRAKLGLYIALIELDIEHQLGRHPRFLVLDSPAREEGDQVYVEGLKTTFAYIQERFGNKLQIFIGTAQRDLALSVDAEQVEVKAEMEYFF